jgi:hypothetical protein
MKEIANRWARFDELLGVVLTAEQCRTLASIAAAARDDRGLDDLVAGRGRAGSARRAAAMNVIKWGFGKRPRANSISDGKNNPRLPS